MQSFAVSDDGGLIMTVSNVDGRVRGANIRESDTFNGVDVLNVDSPISAKGDVFMFSGGGYGLYFTR